MFRRKFLTAAIVAAVATLTGPAVSQAAFEIKIEQLNVSTGAVIGSAIFITDGGGSDGDGDSDAISYTNHNIFGGVDLKVTGSAKEASSGSQLSQVSTNVVNTTGGAVRLRISSTREYTEPSGQNLKVLASASLNQTNNYAYSGTYNAYINGNGGLFSNGTQVNGGNISPGTGVGQAGGVLANPNGVWSLTEVFDVTINNDDGQGHNGQITGMTGDMNVTGTDDAPTLDAPAPGGLVMALGAVPFLGLIRRRLRKSEAAA